MRRGRKGDEGGIRNRRHCRALLCAIAVFFALNCIFSRLSRRTASSLLSLEANHIFGNFYLIIQYY